MSTSSQARQRALELQLDAVLKQDQRFASGILPALPSAHSSLPSLHGSMEELQSLIDDLEKATGMGAREPAPDITRAQLSLAEAEQLLQALEQQERDVP